ncbi:hypothetical protein [Actinomadura formosensis]|uniref:hypothetical protein n=1 Tax=Actinomadura formosensis TaxID=60706 RepID=UPI000A4B3BB6|nr:hypothetical protein [Actinomadura formosensis]
MTTTFRDRPNGRRACSASEKRPRSVREASEKSDPRVAADDGLAFAEIEPPSDDAAVVIPGVDPAEREETRRVLGGRLGDLDGQRFKCGSTVRATQGESFWPP